MSTATKKAKLEKVLAEALNEADKASHTETREELMAAKLQKQNTKGEILQCRLTLANRPMAPNPLVVTVNDEIRWIPRGVEVVVPWYVVTQMKNNIERRFFQVKEDGKNVVKFEDSPSEPFSYSPIDPAPGVTV